MRKGACKMKTLELGQIIDGKTRDYYNGLKKELNEWKMIAGNLSNGQNSLMNRIHALRDENEILRKQANRIDEIIKEWGEQMKVVLPGSII
jgi:predicted  nucleic acid-binding Zn-ribbon protein